MKDNQRLSERDSVNTPWDQPANPEADEIRRGDKRRKPKRKGK